MDAQRRTLEEWLDDLCVRFIVNLPQSELSGFDRIGTHVEEAHWFYEDFIRPLDPTMPQMNLRTFALRIFQHCPLTSQLGPELHEKAYSHWIGYKKRIPVRGAILLNEAMDSVVLVKGWSKSSSWMFPRGKINEGEDDLDCAIREVYEETGFNAAEAGLIPENRALPSFEVVMRDQHVKLFVIPNVPMDIQFEARTRKEISKIEWYRLADLPTGRSAKKPSQDNNVAALNANKFFMVSSFLGYLNKWIRQQRRRKDRTRQNQRNGHLSQAELEDVMTEEDGMITEAVPDPPPSFATAESYEAASKELHSLLKIRAPTQRSQAGPSQAREDQGKVLLAMLQQKQNVPVAQQATQQHPHLQQTQLDRNLHVAPHSETQHHHHHHYHYQTEHRLPTSSHQAPPTYPIQPSDINSQLRSVLGVSTAPEEHIMHHSTQGPNQQLEATMASAPEILPALSHPQPLPPQASHILAATATSAPSQQNVRPSQTMQPTNVAESFSASHTLNPQPAAGSQQHPDMRTRNALLDAFKKGANPASELPPTAHASQLPPPGGHRPSQPQSMNPALLGFPYAGRPAAPHSQTGASDTMPLRGSPRAAFPQTSLRPSNVSHLQQKALLDIFKKPSPQMTAARPALKENSDPLVPTASGPQKQMHYPGTGRMQGNGHLASPYGSQNLAMRPKEFGQPSPQPQPSHAGVHLLGAFGVDGASGDNKMLPKSSYPNHNDVVGCPPYNNNNNNNKFNQPDGTPLATSALGSNISARRQEADPQQLQKLMSLFAKPAIGSALPSASPATATMSQSPGIYSAARLATPNTYPAAPGASPGFVDVANPSLGSRRSSQQQTPISPENEKFLLNYLKSAVSEPPK
ncbi:hypothetical protein BD289DRAFT_97139 [Coniella lustricola]|uniref:Nudix hydrolase domain-containing protein n=1 Tax=Coniella lustricola TaxID=2025994 RepID=A0A2T3AMV6_9PEZI|nr:hypothetical protein BD289DRAFT_97139 [Coniella lustricola]